ncbi:MAG: glycosyltransferase [Candidatus Altiarchaeales archaeon]|nr:glycosyltransferase [Candidatus Altiarchaeales archaeon]MBD3415514.1 glycosyltransferase [Candidatus Altiarchaeales archaeon]
MSKEDNGTVDVLMCASIPDKVGGMHNLMYYTAKHVSRHGFNCRLMFQSSLESRLHPLLKKYLSPYVIASRILWRLVNGERMRFVEIHEPSAYFYCILAKLLPLLPRCLIRSHGPEELVFEMESRVHDFPKKTRVMRGIRNSLNNLAFSTSEANIIYNKTCREYLKRKHPGQKVILSTISVEPELYMSAEKKAHEGVNVAFIGTWNLRKGSGPMEEIIPAVLERNKNIRFHLLGVGDGPDEKARKAFTEHAENVQILPSFDGYDELKDYLESMDILLLPSLYESGPFSVLEAMAFKLAVVCSTHCLTIVDIARDGEDAVMIDPSDVQGYVDAVLGLAVDRGKRMRIAENGFKAIREHTWDLAVSEYVRYLEDELRKD